MSAFILRRGVTSPLGNIGLPNSALYVSASGSLVNAANKPVTLIGSNLTGINNQTIPNFGSQISPWGNGTGSMPQNPNPIWMASQKMNVARLTVNVQSFLGITYNLLTGANYAAGAWGAATSADPNGNYKSNLLSTILQLRANGQFIIIDCHENAPQFTFGGVAHYLPAIDQAPFMDTQTCSLYWSDPTQSIVAWLATNFGSPAFNATYGYNGGLPGQYWSALDGGYTGFQWAIFELFNEPYFGNQGFVLTTRSGTFGNPAWKANNGGNPYVTTNGGTPPVCPISLGATTAGEQFVMLYGGYCDWFYQQGQIVNSRGIPAGFRVTANPGLTSALAQSWQVYGYQQALDGIRALGATNVVLVNGPGFASSLSTIPYYMPVDSISPPQIGTGWHAYESGASTYPNTLDPGSGTATCLNYPTASATGTSGLGYAIPVMITEIATSSGNSTTQPDPYYTRMTAYADSLPKGSFHFVDFAANNAAAFGATGPVSDGENIYGAPISVTGGISGSILTITAISGGPFAAGWVITSGFQSGYGTPYILPFGTGGTTGTGGLGTYQIDYPQTVAPGTTMQISQLLPWRGQGQSFCNWSSSK